MILPINEVKARLAEVGADLADGPSTGVDHSASDFQLKPLAIASVVLVVVGLLRRVTASPHG